ncbi:MAG TPA: DinB family protein [Anaerolineaceae bacterium]
MGALQEVLNAQQTALREALEDNRDLAGVSRAFLAQFCSIHQVEGSGQHSFEEDVWEGVTFEAARRVPANCEHSYAWIFWHLARCEDITMSLLIAGEPQVLYAENWLERTRSPFPHTGNAMDVPAVRDFSAQVDVEAVRGYYQAVSLHTLGIFQRLTLPDFKQKVNPARMAVIRAQGDLPEAATEVYDYWSRQSFAGLLLMPATRHHVVHMNEAMRMKSKVLKG